MLDRADDADCGGKRARHASRNLDGAVFLCKRGRPAEAYQPSDRAGLRAMFLCADVARRKLGSAGAATIAPRRIVRRRPSACAIWRARRATAARRSRQRSRPIPFRRQCRCAPFQTIDGGSTGRSELLDAISRGSRSPPLSVRANIGGASHAINVVGRPVARIERDRPLHFVANLAGELNLLCHRRDHGDTAQRRRHPKMAPRGLGIHLDRLARVLLGDDVLLQLALFPIGAVLRRSCRRYRCKRAPASPALQSYGRRLR